MPSAAEKDPLLKIPPRPYKTKKFKRSRFKLLNIRRYELRPGTQTTLQRTPHTLHFYQPRTAHRTPSISISRRIHRAPRRCAGTFAPLLFDPARVVCRVCVRRRLRPSVRLLHTSSRWFLSQLISAAYCGCSTYMTCSVCLRVKDTRTCSNLPYCLTSLQRSSGTNPFHHMCMHHLLCML